MQSEESSWGPKYLARTREWDWHGPAEIDVFAPGDNSVSTVLRDWQTPIFHTADGNHTVDELIGNMTKQYQDPRNVPADLSDVLLVELRKMIDELGIVELWDRAADLDEAYDLPRSERDF